MSHILLQQVLEFHKKYKKTIGDPRAPKLTEVDFRLGLINEELNELVEALMDPTLDPKVQICEVADALGDMIYVIVGAAICWGIDIASVLDAIHESNMTKTVGLKRDDGKVLKGPDFQPPKIKETLEMVAHECDQHDDTEEDWSDSFWPKPTVKGEPGVSFLPEDDEGPEDGEPSQETTDKIMVAAKDQAKMLAMKSIKSDFVSQSDGIPEKLQELAETVSQRAYPEPISNGVPEAIKGQITSYGCFVFDCSCGRTHGVQMTLGSRGGLAPSGKCECICGKAYLVHFPKGLEPVVTVTTIEELRKANA